MAIKDFVFPNVKKIIASDRKNIYHLIYYSVIDAVLVLSIPLASTFVINSVLAHATPSVFVLGGVVLVMFLFVTGLQVLKEYIVEKFQQKVFLQTGIDTGIKALRLKGDSEENRKDSGRLMNYFFDITSIQKFFPILLLDGVGLAIKIVASLLLLLAFDPILFAAGFVFFSGYIFLLLLLGKNGVNAALERSDAKHNTIYFLQNIANQSGREDEVLQRYDMCLSNYARARQKLFGITIRQLALTFFAEGFIFSVFLVIGGYLVIIGQLPLGEFVAAEIVVTSITYALKGFVKQIDYIYDTIEGLHKVSKLSIHLGGKK